MPVLESAKARIFSRQGWTRKVTACLHTVCIVCIVCTLSAHCVHTLGQPFVRSPPFPFRFFGSNLWRWWKRKKIATLRAAQNVSNNFSFFKILPATFLSAQASLCFLMMATQVLRFNTPCKLFFFISLLKCRLVSIAFIVSWLVLLFTLFSFKKRWVLQVIPGKKTLVQSKWKLEGFFLYFCTQSVQLPIVAQLYQRWIFAYFVENIYLFIFIFNPYWWWRQGNIGSSLSFSWSWSWSLSRSWSQAFWWKYQ